MRSVVAAFITNLESHNQQNVATMRLQLGVLLAISAILLVAWSFVVPIFEAPDEPLHWEYARHIHDHGGLPVYGPRMIEACQPPLYYWWIAPIASASNVPTGMTVDAQGHYHSPYPPPHWFQNSPSDFSKYWPLRFARLLTVLLSLVTVLFTYLAGYESTGNCHTGLFAASFVAFLPQFTFRGMNISNDAMLAATSAAATYFIVCLIRRGFSWKIGVAASLCFAAAFLSKINAIIFFPVLVKVLLSGSGNWRVRSKQLSVLLLAFICVSPWLIRNEFLYGEPLATKAMLTAVPHLVRKKSIWSPYFRTDFPKTLAQSFIGVFGWMNVYMSKYVYRMFYVVSLIGAAGLCRSLFQHCIEKRLVLALAALPILAVVSTAQLNLTFEQPQGRYLFPALPALMILAALGMEGLPRWTLRATYCTIAVLCAINLYALGVELRSYW